VEGRIVSDGLIEGNKISFENSMICEGFYILKVASGTQAFSYKLLH
jgi:hypothetical protein